MKDLLDLCVQHDISRVQRRNEIKDGKGTEGTMSYEQTGCYDCDGFEEKCPSYYSRKQFEGSAC